MTRRRRCDERASASLELVAFLPFVVLAALVAGQLHVAAWTATHTTAAARAAARAASLGRDAASAARDTLPGALVDDLESVEPVDDGWRVTVQVPLLFTALSTEDLAVRRFAAFPDSEVRP